MSLCSVNFQSPNRNNVATRAFVASHLMEEEEEAVVALEVSKNWLTRFNKLAKALQNAKEAGTRFYCKMRSLRAG